MENLFKINLLSKRCNIGIIRNMLGVIVVEYNPTITFINELKTVVSEVITNSIVHGYNNEEDKLIDLIIKLYDDHISVDVIDYGIGIEDIEMAKTPLYSSKHDEERSGLGFTIMELFTDKLEIVSKLNSGTSIHLEKKW